MTLKEFIKKYKIDGTVYYTGRREPHRFLDQKQHEDTWVVVLTADGYRSMAVNYYTGVAAEKRNDLSRPVKNPEIADVLNSIAMDASLVESAKDYRDFSEELGYGFDSIAGRNVYEACLKQTENLKWLLKEPTIYEELLWEVDFL